MITSFKRRMKLGTAVLALCGCSSGALASEAALPAEGAALDTAEIVVTAERREASLKNTPLSIQAFGGQALLQANVETIADLQSSIPTLQVGRIGNSGILFLRGIGTDIVNLGSDSSVAFYVDGIYRSRPRDQLVEFVDVARVEVLKGPQGTLYGRNAVGGTINVITNAPGSEFDATIQLGYGNYNALTVGGMLNVPLTPALFVRAAVQYERRDGFSKNLFIAPGVQSVLDNKDLFQGSLKVRALLSDRLTLDLTGTVSRDTSNGFAYKPVETSPNLARDVFGGRVSPNIREVYHELTAPVDGDTWGLNAKLAYEASDSVTLTSLTGYFKSTATEATDRDGTDVSLTGVLATDTSKSLYQEVQVNYDAGGAFRFVGGGTFFDDKTNQDVSLFASAPQFPPAVPFPTLRRISVTPVITFSNRAYGVYGQGTYSIAPNFRLTAGIRYSSETKSYKTNQTVVGAAPVPINIVFSDRKTWSSVTPLFRIELDATPDILTYVSATRGFKSGAFNTASSSLQPALEPESVWSYEAGLRSSFMGGRLRFNAAVFRTDFSNLQVQVYRTGDTVVGVQNASAARITGIEFDGAAVLLPGLSIDVAGGYLDTSYLNYITDDPFDAGVCLTRTSAEPGCVDLSGKRLARAPKFTGNAGLQYIAETSAGAFKLRGDVAYKSSFFFQAFNRPTERQPGYALVNAGLTWTSPGRKFEINVYARNLFDKEYRISQGATSLDLPAGNYWAPPRTFGILARYTY